MSPLANNAGRLLALCCLLLTCCGGAAPPSVCPPGENLARDWVGIYSRGEAGFPCPTQLRANLEPYGAAWIHIPGSLSRSGNTTISASVRLGCAAYKVSASVGLTTQAIQSSTDHYSLTAHATAPYTVAIGVEVQEDCDVVLDQVAVTFGDITPQ